MSPHEMAAASRCSKDCPKCADARARRPRFAGWLMFGIGLSAIGLSLPVDGLPGTGLSIAGMALVWRGWFLIVRPGSAR